MNGTAPIYSISAVARMLDVPVATLRTWEDRYGLVVPERSPSRHRLYTRQQVDELQFIKSQIERGISAADAHRLLRERLQTGESMVGTREQDRGSSRRILIAENDPYAAEFEEHYLQSEGYSVEVAVSVEATRRSLDRQVPSLVVLELLISGGQGLALCREVKRRDPPVRVLAVSTLQAQKRALEAGAEAFLAKPLDRSRLTSAVRSVLSRSPSLPHRSAAI